MIHADRKSPPELSLLISELSEAFANIHLLDSRLVSWGGYSFTELLLCAVDRLLPLSTDWSHLVVLSEQHLPLYPPDQIAAKLPAGESLIHSNKVSDLGEAGRIDVRHRLSMHYLELPGVGPFASGVSVLSESFFESLHHGSNWFVLAREACERLYHVRTQSGLVGPFKNSLLAEETLVPTLLLGTSVGDGLIIRNRNATFVAYPHLSGTPDLTFTENNFFAALAEGYLFIRKRPQCLPAGIKQFLEVRSGLTGPGLEAALKLHRPYVVPAQDATAVDIDSLIAFVESIVYAKLPGVVVQRVSPEAIANVPKMYLLFRHPAWSPQVVVALVSEDLLTFKIVLTWQGHGQHELTPVTVGSFITHVIKARVYGLAFEREILVPDDATSGFVVIEARQDWARLAEIVCLYLHYAGAFSAALL